MNGTAFAQHVREQQLRLAAEGLPQVVVEVGEQQEVGLDARLEVAQLQPLTHEVLDHGVGTSIGDQAPHLRLEHVRLAQLALLGETEQLVVGDARPEEERQSRRELDIADLVIGPGRHVGRVALDAEQEPGAHEHARHGRANTAVEIAAIGTRVVVERERRGDVLGVDGPAERAPRQRRQILAPRKPTPRLRWRAGTRTSARAVGVSLTPVTLYGPSMTPSSSRGMPDGLCASSEARSPGSQEFCSRAARSFQVKCDFVRAGRDRNRRRSQSLVDDILRRVEAFRDAELVELGAADLAGINGLTVDENQELVRAIVTFDAEQTLLDAADEPSREHVFAVGGERMQ